MDKINMDIADIMTNIQIASQGKKEPTDSQAEYAADINNRIGDIERGLTELKHYLTKHNLNDW